MVTPVFGASGSAVVHVRVPTAVLTAGVWRAWAILGALGLALVVGAVVVADRLGRSVVGPADDVAVAARRLASGDLDARAPVAGPPEIADVAAALDALADRIDDMLLLEREAAADLSHRLRTPMTALRLDVEALPPGATGERLIADVRALEETVDRLIRHARAGRASGGVADLGAIVRDRLAFWTPLVEDEGRRWRSTCRAPTPGSGWSPTSWPRPSTRWWATCCTTPRRERPSVSRSAPTRTSACYGSTTPGRGSTTRPPWSVAGPAGRRPASGSTSAAGSPRKRVGPSVGDGTAGRGAGRARAARRVAPLTRHDQPPLRCRPCAVGSSPSPPPSSSPRPSGWTGCAPSPSAPASTSPRRWTCTR